MFDPSSIEKDLLEFDEKKPVIPPLNEEVTQDDTGVYDALLDNKDSLFNTGAIASASVKASGILGEVGVTHDHTKKYHMILQR